MLPSLLEFLQARRSPRPPLPPAAASAWFEGHLARLADAPAHGNRRLTSDRLFHGLLLAFFDPVVRSLRKLQDRRDFDGRLALSGPGALERLARSTTSDALAASDPQLLLPLIEDLRARCPSLAHDDPDLNTLSMRIVAADGTYFTTFCDVAWALRHTKTDGRTQRQARVDVQLDTATWAPQVVHVAGDDGVGEAASVAARVLPGVLYVVDRNFLDFSFLNAVLDGGSHFVLRLRSDGPKLRVDAVRPLTARDAEARVVRDELVTLTGPKAPQRPLRRVTLSVVDRDGNAGEIRLLSDLTDDDVPAAAIAAAYRQRWQIELFFKWLKTFARLDSLLSTSRRGMTFQLYVAVIGTLLMYVQSGRRVSTYALAALSWVADGSMSLEEAMEVIARREREKELARARQARKRALKRLA